MKSFLPLFLLALTLTARAQDRGDMTTGFQTGSEHPYWFVEAITVFNGKGEFCPPGGTNCALPGPCRILSYSFGGWVVAALVEINSISFFAQMEQSTGELTVPENQSAFSTAKGLVKGPKHITLQQARDYVAQINAARKQKQASAVAKALRVVPQPPPVPGPTSVVKESLTVPPVPVAPAWAENPPVKKWKTHNSSRGGSRHLMKP